jgi:triosephosphate isomerase
MHYAGHSERRSLFHETSALVASKTRAALDLQLSVILCVGETEAEREAGTTQAVVDAQLDAVVEKLGKSGKDWRYVSAFVLPSCGRSLMLHVIHSQRDCDCL